MAITRLMEVRDCLAEFEVLMNLTLESIDLLKPLAKVILQRLNWQSIFLLEERCAKCFFFLIYLFSINKLVC